jgi:hypothetical protein
MLHTRPYHEVVTVAPRTVRLVPLDIVIAPRQAAKMFRRLGSSSIDERRADTCARQIAFDNEILRGMVGSTAHGTAVEAQVDRRRNGCIRRA